MCSFISTKAIFKNVVILYSYDDEVGLGILSKQNRFQFEPDGGDNIELVWYQLPIIEMDQK